VEEIREMSGESKDIVTDNIQKLKELFPEVVTEDKIDFEQLKEVLGNYAEEKEERYKFEWHGKSQALRLSQTPSTGTLRPCKEDSKNWEDTENLYIEGDNLEVLKLLQKTYHNRIKMIYIDPPYNTGNDFVYPDNYKDNLHNYLEITGQVDSEGNRISTNSDAGGQFHTKWLNMMYPRLRLARNLLSDDGVIFISIDDNEVHNLRKVCDEVFGEGNFVAEFIIRSNPRGSQSTKDIALEHEYILLYSKSNIKLDIEGYEKKEKDLTDYNLTDGKGKYRLLGLRQRGGAWRKEDRPDMHYLFYVNPKDGKVQLKKDDKYYKEAVPKRPSGDLGRWTWGKEKSLNNLDLLIAKKIDRNGEEFWDVFRKDYLVKNGKLTTKKPRSIFDEKEVNYQNGRNEIKYLFGTSELFDYPKPTFLMKKCIDMLRKNKDIILDFFSGSATTAHAVMKLNAEDGGRRKFIMVQLPEPTDEKSEAYKAGYKTICEIGKERIRRAGDRIVSELKEKKSGQQSFSNEEETVNPDELDIGFKVFKLDSSNLKKWNPDYDNLKNTLESMITNIVDGRSEEDLLYEIMLKFGIDLTYPIETEHVDDKNVYNIGNGALFICLDKNITKDVATFIASKKDEINSEVTRVVFRDNGFASDADKTNIVHILKHAGIEEIMSV
jgi:adenine-specific DNA-methyltransferase